MQEKVNSSLPPNPFVVQTVLRLAKDDIMDLLERAKTLPLGKYDVSHINKYLCCYICLGQGQWPAVAQNLKLNDYKEGIKRHTVKKNKDTYHVILVKENKSVDDDTVAQIVINTEWKAIFDNYLKYVRQPIVKYFKETPQNFFLQADGKAFLKVSSALTVYQRQYGISKTFSCSDARRSFMAYVGRANPVLRGDIIDFLRYAEGTARTCFQSMDSIRAVNLAIAFAGDDQTQLKHIGQRGVTQWHHVIRKFRQC